MAPVSVLVSTILLLATGFGHCQHPQQHLASPQLATLGQAYQQQIAVRSTGAYQLAQQQPAAYAPASAPGQLAFQVPQALSQQQQVHVLQAIQNFGQQSAVAQSQPQLQPQIYRAAAPVAQQPQIYRAAAPVAQSPALYAPQAIHQAAAPAPAPAPQSILFAPQSVHRAAAPISPQPSPAALFAPQAAIHREATPQYQPVQAAAAPVAPISYGWQVRHQSAAPTPAPAPAAVAAPHPQPAQPQIAAPQYAPAAAPAPAAAAAPASVPASLLRPAAVHYASIGENLNGDYKFGYRTGDGGSFREESRLPDGTVQGQYGFIDAEGKQRVVKYTAGVGGFQVLGGDNAAPAAPAAAAPQQWASQG